MSITKFLFYLLINILISIIVALGILAWRGQSAEVATVSTPVQAIESGQNQNPQIISATLTPLPSTQLQPTPPQKTFDTHTLRSGESLGQLRALYGVSLEDIQRANGLANVNSVIAGQEIIIPYEGYFQEPTAAPTAIPTIVQPLPTAEIVTGESSFELRITAERGNLQTEAVALLNTGDVATNLNGWKLMGSSGQMYQFSNQTIFGGGIIQINSTNGQDDATNLYWNLPQAVWNSGDTIHLLDTQGIERATIFVQ